MMSSTGNDGNARRRREAARWVTRRELDRVTGATEQAFHAWLAEDPANRAAFRFAEEAWTGLADMRQSPEYARLLGRPTLRERIVALFAGGGKSLSRRHGRDRLPVAAAAMLGLFLLISAAILSGLLSGRFDKTPPYMTEVAEIRDLSLPDGSKVTLGARSRIDLEFTEAERRVRLAGGEAFFSVERDAERPFFVEVGEMVVRVVGTRFDVRRGPRNVRISVVEGVVEVCSACEPTDPDSFASPASRRRLHAGEGLIADLGKPLNVAETIMVSRPGEWRTGRLIFDSVPLLEMVADVNRYYRGEVVIDDENLEDLRVTTSFRLDQIEQMLESLEAALPLRVVRRADGEVRLVPAGERQ